MQTPPADFDTLDAAATLAAVEGALEQRRAAESRDLALAAHWADLHAADPQLGRGGRRVWAGEDRLVQVGGEGTPQVQELCLTELAISRRVHPHAARRLVLSVALFDDRGVVVGDDCVGMATPRRWSSAGRSSSC